VLEGEALAVGPVAQEGGKSAFAVRAEDVGAQHEAVVHPDRDVPFDLHEVILVGAARSASGRIARACACRCLEWPTRHPGRAAAIAASVASWNTTYGGTDWLRACAVRHALSRSNTSGLTADPM